MELFENLVVAAVAGAFGLVPVVVQGAVNRSQERQRANRLARLRAELEFVDKLHSVRGAVRPDAPTTELLEQALHRLTAAYEALVVDSARADATGPRALSDYSRIRRWLLVFRPLSASGRILHTLFYMCCLMAGTLLISEWFSPTINDATGEPYGWRAAIVGTLLFAVLPALFLRALAMRSYTKSLS